VISALGGGIINTGRIASNAHKMLTESPKDTPLDHQAQIDQSNSVQPSLPQEKNNVGK
jgi:hypothetical protein